jgi:Spy/CpxP family protein refolding chaperone
MKRSLTLLGAAVVVLIAIVGAVAASQAQSPQNPQASGDQRPGPPVFDCGPEPGLDGQRPQRPGEVRGRGQGGERPGLAGRPGGPGGRGGPGRGGRGNPLCGLDLTEEQKSQIAAIHQKAQEQIEAVLTPEQREKLHARRGK